MTDWFILISLIKCAFLVVLLLTVVPGMIWLERRGSAWMQNRVGPNRLGPFGLIQPVADAIKFIFKEDFAPGHVNQLFYRLAPIVCVIPAFMTFAVLPFAAPITMDGQTLTFQVADLDVGVLYILAIVSLGVYGIMIAGWSSNNKYSLLGALRSSSQMISYELAMGCALVGILMVFSSVSPNAIATAQGAPLWTIGGWTLPAWGVFLQPVGFIIFLVSTYAETNRLPFDLPEGESEIVAGYHLEYGAMKFASFFLAEYINMFTAAGLVTTLYFGGWQLLPGMGWLLESLQFTGAQYEWTRAAFQAAAFLLKVGFFMWLFVWVRWTIPRFRYDQVMDLGWKVLLPLALANLFVTALLVYQGVL